MKGGVNQQLLKRLMRKVIESIVLEPERIALKYWTSNESRLVYQFPRQTGMERFLVCLLSKLVGAAGFENAPRI